MDYRNGTVQTSQSKGNGVSPVLGVNLHELKYQLNKNANAKTDAHVYNQGAKEYNDTAYAQAVTQGYTGEKLAPRQVAAQVSKVDLANAAVLGAKAKYGNQYGEVDASAIARGRDIDTSLGLGSSAGPISANVQRRNRNGDYSTSGTVGLGGKLDDNWSAGLARSYHNGKYNTTGGVNYKNGDHTFGAEGSKDNVRAQYKYKF